MVLTVAGAALGDNGLCWYNSNRSYERCCTVEEAPEDCWAGYGLTEDFCCHPLPAGIQDCYESVERKVEAHKSSLETSAEAQAEGDPDHAYLLEGYAALYRHLLGSPMELYPFLCEYPSTGALWSEACSCCEPVQNDCAPQTEEQVTAANTLRTRCCYPVFVRRIREAPDPELEAAIERHLGTDSIRWSQTTVDAVTQRWFADGVARGCLIKIRGGIVEACQEAWACPDFDCSYLRAFLLTLQIINELNPLPDLGMVLNAGDVTFSTSLHDDAGHEDVPVFTRTGTHWTHSVALPFEWQLHPAQCQKHIRHIGMAAAKHPWESRQAKLFWRGSASNCLVPGCDITQASTDGQAMAECGRLPEGALRDCTWNWSTWLRMPRGRLVWTTRAFSGVDARFVRAPHINIDPSLADFLEGEGLLSERTAQEDQVLYKYAIAVQGDSAPDRLYWQMFAGVVVLIPDGPWQVFAVQDMLKPYVHYVPVRYDLRDLVEKVLWLQEHDAEARQIALNAAKFARRYLTCEAIIYFLDRLLRAYARRLTYL